jgi:hypothetical protein
VFVVLALIGGHLFLPYGLSHVGVSLTLASVLTALMILKHRGFLAALFGSVRNRRQRRTPR